ncbi:MAG: hypothetical protein AAF268_11290 [Cyanobacteria bacterium P01_A01_bin.3]
MNAKHLTFGLFGLAVTPFIFGASASACTPAPDNPDGCDGINGGRIRVQVPLRRIQRWPGPFPPTCLSCPSLREATLEERINPSALQAEQLNQLQHQHVQPAWEVRTPR